MIPHLLKAGNSLFSQIRCKVKTFSTISSINSKKILLFAANLSFLLTFLQEYAENWRKIVAYRIHQSIRQPSFLSSDKLSPTLP
jgi:hypothetical protein